MSERPRVLVDMSATLIHHGHVRLLRAAGEMGTVVVALTTDEEVRRHKGYDPELSYEERREVLAAIRYVDEVVPSPWLIDESFLDRHRIDFLLHGADHANDVPAARVKVVPRTPGISSTLLRTRVLRVIGQLLGDA